jgi:hypothetical protein
MKKVLMLVAAFIVLAPMAMAATRAPLGEDFTAGT